MWKLANIRPSVGWVLDKVLKLSKQLLSKQYLDKEECSSGTGAGVRPQQGGIGVPVSLGESRLQWEWTGCIQVLLHPQLCQRQWTGHVKRANTLPESDRNRERKFKKDNGPKCGNRSVWQHRRAPLRRWFLSWGLNVAWEMLRKTIGKVFQKQQQVQRPNLKGLTGARGWKHWIENQAPQENRAGISAQFCVTHSPMASLLHCLSTQNFWPLRIYLLEPAEVKSSLEKAAVRL